MAAANTDKLKKLSKRWVGQIGAAGVADASVTTIPLSSTTNLATDTAVIATIDRVDANGAATAALEEAVIGVVSGSNLINCVRATEGTAQAHNAGAVVEILVTAKGYNDIIDWALVEHSQLGVHDPTKIIAGALKSATTTVSVIAATAPTSGQVLTATGGSTATWQTASGGLLSTTQYAPQGFLINGKIVPSVSSSNLTVAIKGMDGNDPSVSNPVYCRIGDTVRTLTTALSVTKNAGTNWFNSGSSELATKERDYFVYLGYNATDGVVIGFSPIPFGTQYSVFSATTTNEKYAAISTITNAVSTDYYEVIGRFAATLSAGAGYTWTVPTFTSINLIQRPIFLTRWLTTVNFTYMMNGTDLTIFNTITVTANSTSAAVSISGTYPFTYGSTPAATANLTSTSSTAGSSFHGIYVSVSTTTISGEIRCIGTTGVSEQLGIRFVTVGSYA